MSSTSSESAGLFDTDISSKCMGYCCVVRSSGDSGVCVLEVGSSVVFGDVLRSVLLFLGMFWGVPDIFLAIDVSALCLFVVQCS